MFGPRVLKNTEVSYKLIYSQWQIHEGEGDGGNHPNPIASVNLTYTQQKRAKLWQKYAPNLQFLHVLCRPYPSCDKISPPHTSPSTPCAFGAHPTPFVQPLIPMDPPLFTMHVEMLKGSNKNRFASSQVST